MKGFLLIHITIWLLLGLVVTAGAHVWDGKFGTTQDLVFMVYFFFYVLPLSAVVGLLCFFLKRTFSISVKKSEGQGDS